MLPFLVLVVLASGCSRRTAGSPPTTLPMLTTSSAPVTTTTTTTTTLPPLVGTTGVAYEIVRREEGPAGDTVVVLLESGASVTDLDLYDILADVVDRFAPIARAYVVDSPEAVDLVLLDEPTDAQRAVLATHFLARLEDGFRVVYEGPFADVGSTVLGS